MRRPIRVDAVARSEQPIAPLPVRASPRAKYLVLRQDGPRRAQPVALLDHASAAAAVVEDTALRVLVRRFDAHSDGAVSVVRGCAARLCAQQYLGAREVHAGLQGEPDALATG